MSSEQVKKMIEIRRDSGLLRADKGQENLPDQVTPQWIEQEVADLQLAAGLRALIGKLADGQWPVVGQSGAEELVRQTMRDNLLRQRTLLNERLDLVNQELVKLDDPLQDEDQSEAERAVTQDDLPPADQQPADAATQPSTESSQP